MIDPNVLSRVECGKFKMLDYWSHAFFAKISAKFIPVISIINGECFDPV